MDKDVIHVDFTPDGHQRHSDDNDIIWSVIAALALVAGVVLFIELAPFMLAVLAVSAVLAGFSTWRVTRRRNAWRRLGWPAPRLSVKTYLGYLAAWFIGLLAIVPLAVFSIVIATIVLAFVGFIIVIAFLASLFKPN